MGLTPEFPAWSELGPEPRVDEEQAAASAFGRAWAARVLGSGPLTDDARSAVARAIARCHAHAGLVPPSAVCWVATPADASAFLDGDDSVVLCRTETGPDPDAGRWHPPWVEWLAGARPMVRVVGWLLSPLVGLILGVLLVCVVLMLWLGLAMWLVIAGAVVLLRVCLKAVVSRLPPKSFASGAAVLVVLVLWGLAFAAAVRAIGRPESRLPLPDPLGTWAVMAGAIGGAVGLPLLSLRSRRARRRRPRTVRRGFDPYLAARRFEEVGRKATETAGRVGGPVWTELNQVVAELDPLARVEAGRLDGALARWAWAENRAGGGGSDRESWFGPSLSRRRAALRAFETAARVHWRAAGREAVAVEPPLEVHGGPDGVHRIDGAAVVWADGSTWYALNGVRLPRRPDSADWTADEIHYVRSSEARRVMIEAIGWDAYLEQAAFTLLAEAPDPGNPPHRLGLYALPDPPYRQQGLLVMTNGSPGRDGRQRRYAEFVPDRFSDPVEAAAWQYGVPGDVYRQLQRRT